MRCNFDAADKSQVVAKLGAADQVETVDNFETTRQQPWHWRGFMLDVVRHFFNVEQVKSVIDLCHYFQLNRLHLHLSDDQGWRLEIPGWPELTQHSSATAVGGAEGGYYTIEQWQELRAYAADRGIVLVPEIDIPGHTNAALHAVAGLNPDGHCAAPYYGTDVGFSTLTLAAPDTRQFVEDVFTYLTQISDGWVHIGGDESHVTSAEDYRDIVTLAVRTVHAQGARVVAWQEAADLLEPGDVVQVWAPARDGERVASAAQRGVRVLASPGPAVYFDMKYYPQDRLGITWAGLVTSEVVRTWDLVDSLPGVPAEAYLGVEAALWTETVVTTADLFTMLLPRMVPFAAIAAGERLEAEEMWERIRSQIPTWQARGWSWYQEPELKGEDD